MSLHRYFAFVFFILLPTISHAAEKEMGNAIQTISGIYSSIYIHEAGHALFYDAFGATDISVAVPRPGGSIFSGVTRATAPDASFSQTQMQLIAASGLVTSALVGEIVIQKKGLHNSPYAQSVLGTSVISNLLHVTTYYTHVRGENGYTGNDIDMYEQAGGNPHILSAGLLTYSLWSLHRMKKGNIPLFYVGLHF